MRIILADDHSIVRYGIRMAIEASGVGRIVGEVATAEELVSTVKQIQCDVIVTDLSMPASQERDGVLLVERLRRLTPHTPIVVITAMRNLAIVKMLVSRGALAVVDKGSGIDDLIMALRYALRREVYLSGSIRKLLREAQLSERSLFRESVLTRSEIEVLRMFAYDGLSILDIAKRLHRSPKTISKHKRNAQEKLGLATNQELLDFCRNNEKLSQ
ncbi:LuxR family transcriptional regulator [Pandoraea anapnoica]|uniref:LuxR family transcriptional regulator n=1 Tax=Pandoraea anapnoica TaxID=2508301 RepID=A0A5E5AJN1_9BURK|nr:MULTISPECIES: response regulator transcription factor [Pandoraea]VVE42801.1 LuxR family transcriptional regulator [Pandoraea iniqua]VVE73217.1 LuxR family transcriptional regulator [Pandoraea anapnoica]